MLIETKLQVPQLSPRMTLRTHLLNRLSAAKSCRLILISGPAGSGKTTLACQWIRQEKLQAAWYSLDEYDNEFDIFCRYLLNNLINTVPQLTEKIGILLQDQKRLSGKEVIPLVVHALLKQPKDIYLVLDDFHLITDKEIHDTLGRFLKYLPPRLHMVIISRYSFPKALSRARIQHQTFELSASDLKFTENEARAFFMESDRIGLSRDQIHDLIQHTDGWAAGIRLISLSLERKDPNDNLDQALNRVYEPAIDYLFHDVISVQSEKVRTFLFKTALLDKFNADLCKEMTGMEDAADILDHLYRINLFLIPLDSARKWYRYHHILSESIRHRIELSSPEFVAASHRKAALWLAEHEYLEDAFRHAFASNDFEFAANMLEDYCAHWKRHELAFGMRWILKLPPKIFHQRSMLKLYECMFKLESRQLSHVKTIMADIEQRQPHAFEKYSGVKKTDCQDLYVFLKCLTQVLLEPSTLDMNQLDETIQKISPRNKFLSGFIKLTITGSHISQGNLLLAEKALKDASKIIFSSKSNSARMSLYRITFFVERLQGRLHRAEAITQEASQFLDSIKSCDITFKFEIRLLKAWIYYLRNDLDKALEYATESVRYLEQARDVEEIIEGNMLLSFIYLAKGEEKRAYEYMQKAQSISKKTNTQSFFVAQGAIIFEWPCAKQRKVCLDEPFSFHFASECIVQARHLHLKGRYPEAAHILKVLRRRSLKRNLMEVVLQIDILHSAVLYALNDYQRAKDVMEQALSFAGTEGYVRPFVDEAPIISQILRDMAGNPTNTEQSFQLKTILKACGIGRHGAKTPSRLSANGNDDLSPREIEIFQMMAAGYRNAEIAEKSFISLSTVKTHINSIFSKLGVKSRVQAILWAQEQELFGEF